jgi:hypothetical protein
MIEAIKLNRSYREKRFAKYEVQGYRKHQRIVGVHIKSIFVNLQLSLAYRLLETAQLSSIDPLFQGLLMIAI